jgi:hypothetical protein
MKRPWFLMVMSLLIFTRAYAGDEGAGSSDSSESSSKEEEGDFNQQLLTIEHQVDEMKERVFRAKATLQLLKEVVIAGAAGGARTTIWHVNNLGTAYKLESITYMLDGQTRFNKADTSGALSDSKEFKIYDGAINPGTHNLGVDFQLRPTGLGVFTYAKNYQVNVRSSYAFTVDVGKQCTVHTTLTDRGNLANSFEERAKASFEIKCERMSE